MREIPENDAPADRSVSDTSSLPLNSSNDDDDDTEPLLVNAKNNRSCQEFNNEFISRRMKLQEKYEKRQRGFLGGAFGLQDDNTGNVLILGLALCLILAAFWLMDSLKDAVLADLVGMEYQPTAKILSVLSTLLLVTWMEYGIGQSRSQSRGSKNNTRIFYVVGFPYFLLFMIVASGLREYEKSTNGIEGSNGWRLLGFLTYVAIESFGSIMVATFWAYTNEILDLDTAKKSYGIIVAIGEIIKSLYFVLSGCNSLILIMCLCSSSRCDYWFVDRNFCYFSGCSYTF